MPPLERQGYRKGYRTVGELDRSIDPAIKKNGRKVLKVYKDTIEVYPLWGGEMGNYA
jgi:hypothetical protein